MNEAQIEMFLRRAPMPAVPAGLLDRLMADVNVASNNIQTAVSRPMQIRFRRWIPALAFSMLFLSCLIMVAVQVQTVARLKQENRELRAATAGIDQLRQQRAALESSSNQSDELSRLRAENEDLHRLQAEAAALQPYTSQVSRLRAENRAQANRPLPNAQGEDLDAVMKARAEKTACINNLKQIGLAIRMYSSDNRDRFPTSILQVTNYLNSPALLVCPADALRQSESNDYRTLGWATPGVGDSSYQFFLTGDKDLDRPSRISAICPIHGNFLLADGSVQSVGPDNQAASEITVNGRLEMRR